LPDKKKGFSLPDLSLTHPLATLLLLVGVVVVGILSYHRMGVDLFPRVQFPLVSVTVTDPGDSPRGITRDIALPLEGKSPRSRAFCTCTRPLSRGRWW
jgi:Cation/multidrug efflux pump